MFHFEHEASLVNDREDLIALLRMRFGNIASGIIEEIYQLNDLNSIERLILVAANVPDLKTFLTELEEGKDSFKIVGGRFNPLGSDFSRGDVDGTEK
ncbi:MAG TPA: hypothetical protein VK029_10580 [Pseudogracilibacillus sp.]|nr:hypothetical protein [Pseudogracilibacillus sp.]